MGLRQSRSQLFEKLMHIQEGIHKHQMEPGFPDLSHIGNIEERQQRLSASLSRAVASRARAQKDTAAARREALDCDQYIGRLTRAIQAWASPRADVMRDFGIEPYRKRGRKPRAGKKSGGAGGEGGAG